MTEQRSIELEIKEELDIDESDILSELRRHSAKYFYWGTMWARSSKQRRRLRLKLKELEARLANDLRREVTTADPKGRVTEAMKNDYLYSHPNFLAAEQELIQSEYMEEVLDVARDGMKQRGMALNELARQNRTETIYGDEFKAMKNEYNERVGEMGKEIDPTKTKRHRRTKAEMEAGQSAMEVTGKGEE
uniref:Uncharacterized protein n=1 Tax=viral metagenome TaxID=1070528 RepID=A0A6M3KDE4_9ZZZZ